MSNPKRCECCHRYAPKAVLGTEDGKVIQGDPPGQCRGNAAIEEARDWARLWKARALEAGWRKPWSAEDQAAMDKINQEEAERKALAARHPVLAANAPESGESNPATSKKLNAKTLTNDEKLHARWLEEGKDLVYCAGPRRHFFIVDSPMHEGLLETGCFHCGAFPEAIS